MTKTLLCGVAAIAFTLAAPTAFAQDAEVDVKAKVKAEQMMDKAADTVDDAADDMMDAAEDTMDEAEDAMDDAADDMDDAAEDAMEDAEDAVDDAEDAVEDSMDDMGDDKADEKMTMEIDVDATVGGTVECPTGTEAQADGSCMITGDWTPED